MLIAHLHTVSVLVYSLYEFVDHLSYIFLGKFYKLAQNIVKYLVDIISGTLSTKGINNTWKINMSVSRMSRNNHHKIWFYRVLHFK